MEYETGQASRVERIGLAIFAVVWVVIVGVSLARLVAMCAGVV